MTPAAAFLLLKTQILLPTVGGAEVQNFLPDAGLQRDVFGDIGSTNRIFLELPSNLLWPGTGAAEILKQSSD